MRDGAKVIVGGLVLIRQRPGTAKGVVFATLEDETGVANAVVWPDIFQANRRTVMASRFLVVHGRLQRAGEVIHVVAQRFTDLTPRLADLRHGSACRCACSAAGIFTKYLRVRGATSLPGWRATATRSVHGEVDKRELEDSAPPQRDVAKAEDIQPRLPFSSSTSIQMPSRLPVG